MFRQIRTRLDGSPPAERALPFAAQIAAASGASVRVVEPPIVGSTTNGQPVPHMDAAEAARTAAQVAAAGYLDLLRARSDLGGIQVRGRVPVTNRPGAATALQLDHERDAGIDLVVAITRCWTGLDRLAMDSVAARLQKADLIPTWAPNLRLTACNILPGRAINDAHRMLAAHVRFSAVMEGTWLSPC